ncbi:MAG: hypothetical protein RLP44_01620 [Aggregatilineales bacterium]
MPESKRVQLQRQWDAVPAERQAYYRRIYQREVLNAGANTDDAAELAVLKRLIDAYRQQALVPVGERWVIVPDRVRIAAQRGQKLASPAPPARRSQRVLGLILLPIAGILLFVIFSALNGGSDETDTLTAYFTPTATLTPTPEASPTPTPLALEESDRVIEAGEGDRRRTYYPVLLQIHNAADTNSRVFVVQERTIQTADWRFDMNPDTASWISGLVIQPVLGIPFSDNNLTLFRTLRPGARFDLHMNTGDILHFVYADKRQVTRQETDIFRQDSPGLALILIGETDQDGLLTQQRWIVEAVYPVDQEIERLRSGELAAIIPAGDSGNLAGTDGIRLAVLSTALEQPDGLPADLTYALIDLDITTASQELTTSALNWVLEDEAGNRFNDDPRASQQGDFIALPAEIPPGSRIQATIGFLAGRDVTSGRLLVTNTGGDVTVFAVTFDQPPPPPTLDAVDVQVRSVQFDAGQLIVDARLYNPQSEPISLSDAAVWLVLGYAASPLGPELPPYGGVLPSTLDAESVLDVTLTFPYAGEPYGRLRLLSSEYALQITEGR